MEEPANEVGPVVVAGKPSKLLRLDLKNFKPHDQKVIVELNPDYPNAVARKYLAHEWKKLSLEEQILLKAKRTKRGIKCDICGLVGYFRENCPNQCQSPPSTPDSLASTPREKKKKKSKKEKKKKEEEKVSFEPTLQSLEQPSLSESVAEMKSDPDLAQESVSTQSVGIFWGSKSQTESSLKEKQAKKATTSHFPSSSSSTANNELSTSLLKKKVDLTNARPDATKRLNELTESDQKLGDFSFYNYSETNYDRNLAELTLQQVMRRLIRLLQKQLSHNIEELESTFDVTLLNPPASKVSKHFYPPELKDDPILREYYLKQESKKKDDKLSYRYQGALRPLDDLDIIRGGNTDYSELYHTKKNAGESMHAKNTWKSVLAKNDTLANSDPSLVRKQKKIDALFENQSKWIKLQSMDMKFRNDRFEHLVYIIQSEIEKEHSRENRLLLTLDNKSMEKTVAMDLWQERLTAVDLMVKVLQAYKFTAGLEEADFLLYCLSAWQGEWKKKVTTKKKSNSDLMSPQKGNDEGNVTITEEISSLLSPSSKATEQTKGSNSLLLRKQSTLNTISTANDASLFDDNNNNTDDDDEHDEDTNALPLSISDMRNRKNKKNTKKKKTGVNYNRRDLVASVTNPYFQDTQFLESLKKKHDKMFEKSKQGMVFTAVQQREMMAKEKEKQEKLLSDLDKQNQPSSMQTLESLMKMKSTKPVESALNAHEFDHDRMMRMKSSTSVNSMNLATISNDYSVGSVNTNLTNNYQSAPSMVDSMIDLPSLEEITSHAMQHKEEIDELEEKKQKKQKELMSFLKPKENQAIVRHRFIHPKEIDAQHIAKMKQSFKRAGLANRIRKGRDDDLANVLPALIPVPQAFDGDSQTVSHTGQSIIFKLKKNMVLSDLGYARQSIVPLFVRNTLMEKEGTSKHGDPTQEELNRDRRYVHFVGRPLVRFNPPEEETSTALGSSTADNHKRRTGRNPTSLSPLSHSSSTSSFLKNDLAALNESFASTMKAKPTTADGVGGGGGEQQLDKKIRKENKQLQEEVKAMNIPITNSLVRLVFKKEPSLEDLKYLSDEF
jgi:hypothetical protein